MPEPDDDRGALEPLWTPADVARLLGLGGGDAAVYELCRARASDPLPSFRCGKYVRFRRSELLAWLERQRCSKREHPGAASAPGKKNAPDTVLFGRGAKREGNGRDEYRRT